MNNKEIIKKMGATGNGIGNLKKMLTEARADERQQCIKELEKLKMRTIMDDSWNECLDKAIFKLKATPVLERIFKKARA